MENPATAPTLPRAVTSNQKSNPRLSNLRNHGFSPHPPASQNSAPATAQEQKPESKGIRNHV